MRQAIEDGLRCNWQSLFNYALRLSGSRDAAADLVQSCAVKALDGSAAAPRPEAMRAWLFKILRHLWIDGHRRDRTAQAAIPAEESPEIAGRYDDSIIAEITVRQALEQLPHDHREIIALVDLAGFRYGEAATILGVPQGTIMSRLSRARQALLAVIERENLRPFEPRRRHAR